MVAVLIFAPRVLIVFLALAGYNNCTPIVMKFHGDFPRSSQGRQCNWNDLDFSSLPLTGKKTYRYIYPHIGVRRTSVWSSWAYISMSLCLSGCPRRLLVNIHADRNCVQRMRLQAMGLENLYIQNVLILYVYYYMSADEFILRKSHVNRTKPSGVKIYSVVVEYVRLSIHLSSLFWSIISRGPIEFKNEPKLELF